MKIELTKMGMEFMVGLSAGGNPDSIGYARSNDCKKNRRKNKVRAMRRKG